MRSASSTSAKAPRRRWRSGSVISGSIRHLPWPVLKLVPDIGGEVARAIDAFFQQQGNQRVIDDLLARGVVITDAHPPSAKLRSSLDLASVLTELEVPKLTEKRAEQVAGGFDSLAALLKVSIPALIETGLPEDTAEALHAFLAIAGRPRSHAAIGESHRPIAQGGGGCCGREGGSARRTNRRADRNIVIADSRRGERKARSARRESRRERFEEDRVRRRGRSRRVQARQGRRARRRDLGRGDACSNSCANIMRETRHRARRARAPRESLRADPRISSPIAA